MSYHNAKETLSPAQKALPAYAADELTKGGDQAQIVLGDQVYTLRITRAGKLILTK
ncbi:HemP domain containing protein [Sulfitobacter noctilucicola]|uniref:Hemin uptake protein HemP n=1 Tax=Sulfitobacter noctilucicola TaxID=1342301 RepID=A0A7W6Q5W0_9RHOB|nr:hemin uptake protein HemP [Sulfitobacter noctilucicola]KIN64649.1 HemP domain containing protein [Sulfitobacter noctilucicola]MBB4174202.1 hemin uptake protein HemP [Sulfitobacter noctilucicola]